MDQWDRSSCRAGFPDSRLLREFAEDVIRILSMWAPAQTRAQCSRVRMARGRRRDRAIWRSQDVAAAKCSICAGATSAATPSTCAIPRPAHARCRSAGPRGRTSARCPMRAAPMRSCSRATLKAGAPTALQPAGARSAPMRRSGRCGCMTFSTRRPVRLSCPARTCPWSASYSDTDGTGPRRATPTLPMRTLLKRRRRLEM